MTKIWLVTFSNGEEWHICGDWTVPVDYAVWSYACTWGLTYQRKYLRWV